MQSMFWSGQAKAPTSIENLLRELKVSARKPTNSKDLERISKEWAKIPVETCQNLIANLNLQWSMKAVPLIIGSCYKQGYEYFCICFL